MATPVNDMQREFQALCALGGGLNGGPARGRVLNLLRSSGHRLNVWAYQVMAKHLDAYPDANPWHVCFAVSLSWGHLAQLDLAFTGHVVDLLAHWNDDDLAAARSFFLERGPLPIEQSLAGAYSCSRRWRFRQPFPLRSRVSIAHNSAGWDTFSPRTDQSTSAVGTQRRCS